MSTKQEAISLLGGSVAEAARTLGVTYQAVKKWPDPLPPAVADRVVAHLAANKASKAVMSAAVRLRERCIAADADRKAPPAPEQATTVPAEAA